MQPNHLCLSLALSLLIFSATMGAAQAGEPDETQMYEYATCAVYFRMVVGSMSGRYGRDLGPLADIEKEKMNKAMSLARARSAVEYGEEMAEEMFQEEWRAILTEMTDKINRNYENVSRLKAQYDSRCEKMVAGNGS